MVMPNLCDVTDPLDAPGQSSRDIARQSHTALMQRNSEGLYNRKHGVQDSPSWRQQNIMDQLMSK
jgi:hypothetical protein